MELWKKLGIGYLLLINLAGFIIMGIDKRRAKKQAWRIPERTLFLVAALGGSLGSILGMQFFRHKTRHRKFRIGMPILLLIQVCLAGLLLYQQEERETTYTGFGMGTVVSQVIYGSEGETVTEGISQCILTLEEEELSWRQEDSRVAQMNQAFSRGESFRLTDKERQWMQETLELCDASGGAMDITIHPVIELWGIEGDHPAVPEEKDLEEALAATGYERIHLSEDGWLTSASRDSSIDLGAVGKGIAADEVREYLDTQRVSGAVISIGGTILVYGEKPDHQPWQVGVRDPIGGKDAVLGILCLEGDAVVSTSGDYEKYFEEGGVRYHHIFCPDTGYPADSGLASVTVVCSSGCISDGLSTACFVLGYEGSLPLLEQYQAEAVFVTTDRKVYVTDGLLDGFTLTGEGYEYQSVR